MGRKGIKEKGRKVERAAIFSSLSKISRSRRVTVREFCLCLRGPLHTPGETQSSVAGQEMHGRFVYDCWSKRHGRGPRIRSQRLDVGARFAPCAGQAAATRAIPTERYNKTATRFRLSAKHAFDGIRSTNTGIEPEKIEHSAVYHAWREIRANDTEIVSL